MSAAPEYFSGPECDWLRNQVAAVMWQPDRSAQALRQLTIPEWQTAPTRFKPAQRPKQAQSFREWMADEDERERLPTVMTKERQDAVTRTWRSTAPKASTMSVEEYNQWRGESPANAIIAPYVFQKYPTTLYKDGNRIKVGNADDHDRLAQEGWKESP